MRIANARDLGLVVRQARQDRGQTQAALAVAAGVSLRWLSNLEAGKATAELGLVLRTLDELGLGLDVFPVKPEPGQLDLDDLFGNDGGKHG
ncbi:helix-turn-helix domain-containing protein [Catenuloplanes japonicus]|uniref:helix-turn-helix domain-containing protein n=1 Tax=Catenuloplanes japonicus TaxID=33876 RepID=UPI000A0FB7BA|nr:helix-turn-helix domain-containing protein [Catenuloplanes japonicus]